MPPDPSVVSAIEAAVAADPGNAALRVHLCGLLIESGRLADAMAHAAAVLAAEPDHAQARSVLQRASASLLGAQAPEPVVEPAAAPVTADGIDLEGELDAFLADVLADPDHAERRITLADVGGMEDVKRRLEASLLGPLRNPELRALFGKSLRGGLLLYGPPGCGKTFVARAVAGELGASFFSIGLHEVLDMWLGKSEQNLHEVFEHARRNAPAVLFIDEVDALGQKRSNLTHSAGRNVVVQLLTELDSLRDDNEGLFVLGATNQPWDVDPALRRPGRLDRTVLVLPPDRDARAAILAYHTKGRPLGPVDFGPIADRTDTWSGADLRFLCEGAAEIALHESVASGTARPIQQSDFERALREQRPSTRPWFETARNFALFANEGGAYDDLLAYIKAKRLG